MPAPRTGVDFGMLAGLCLAAAMSLSAVDVRADPGPRPGTWYLVGRDTTYWRADMVLEHQEGQRYAGHMTWHAVDGEPAGGTEPFQAEYDPATQTLRMRGEPVRDATGNIASGGQYEARVACDGSYLAYGRWWGSDIADGTWAARYRAGKTSSLSDFGRR